MDSKAWAPFAAMVLVLWTGEGAGAGEGGEAGPRMILIQPGYPGTAKDAQGFLETLSSHISEKAGVPGISGAYHNQSAPALAAIASERPSFGVVSLGFYLAERGRLGLVPRLAARPKDRFVVVARGGDVQGPAALKGQPVAGGPLHEKEFLDRIVFPGAGVSGWEATPTLHASRALRDLVARKKHRAVVLTGRDHDALISLYPGKTLEKVLESDYYPPALVVSFDPAKTAGAEVKNGKDREESGKKGVESAGSSKREYSRLDAGALEKVVRTFSGLSADPRGKEILATMGIDGFEEISGKWLEELERRFDAASKSR
jgi:hypothetical protein